MSKKDNNINNVDEADVNINDTDVTSDTDKDADTVEAQGSSDADVRQRNLTTQVMRKERRKQLI